MPRDTFFRLPEEKRCRIFEAAVDEFAEHRFEQASINNIIKAAGIPRGSFYQYFMDKRDIYAYVFKVIGSEKVNIVSASQLLAQEGQSLYDLIVAVLPRMFEWIDRNPRYYRIGMLMLEDSQNLIQTVVDDMPESINYLMHLLDKEKQAGRMRPGVQPKDVLRLIVAASAILMRAYYESADIEDAKRRILAVYDIIFFGALKQEDI